MTGLSIAIDLIMPGDGEFPPGSALGLAERLSAHPHFGETTRLFEALLPHGLAAGPAGVAQLAVLETAWPDAFSAMVTGIYSLYYSDPEVLAVVARTTGYTPRSPQPDGYTLPAFDPRILEKVAARTPHFRKTGGSDRDQ